MFSLRISEYVIATGLAEQWAAQDGVVTKFSFLVFIKNAAKHLSYVAPFITLV